MPYRTTLLVLALLLGIWPFLAAAQDATPSTAGGTSLDLAAMALTADDVPAEYFDSYDEWWVPAEALSEAVLGGAAASAGLERAYQTFYSTADGAATIHVFLLAFASSAEAEAGAALVDAALRPPLPEGTISGPTHATGPALGDASSVLTVVSYDTWAAGGPRVDVVANSFRRDRLVAGVSVERYTDPPVGTPAAGEATPTAPDAAQTALATSLAASLDNRIAMVRAGRSPAGIDLALADLTLPLAQLVDTTTPVFGGYKSGVDLLRCGICGEENALLPFADSARGGFTRGVVLGPLVDGEPQPPFVSVAVAEFTSEGAALDVLEAMRKAPNDRPTVIPVPRGTRTAATDPAIPAVTAALAFQAVLNEDEPNAPIDSAGVAFVVGNRLVTVDVQGGLTAEVAMAAAIDLATQQAACLAADRPCQTVTLPATLADAFAQT